MPQTHDFELQTFQRRLIKVRKKIQNDLDRHTHGEASPPWLKVKYPNLEVHV
jgi:hypothetical protein